MALIAAHLNAGHSGGDSIAIGIYILSLLPPFSLSVISLMVSVDVKHHVYLVEVSLLFSPAKGEQKDVSEGVSRVGVQAVSE